METLADGLNVLIVRHPIVRIYSAWNDKFSFNSTDNAGFAYGFKKLLSLSLRPLVTKYFQGKRLNKFIFANY